MFCRAQIIELQGASTRELERVQVAKNKNEKEAQETIQTLRRQLADSAVAAEHAKRAQLAAEENVRRMNGAGSAPARPPPVQHHASAPPAVQPPPQPAPSSSKKRASRSSSKKDKATAAQQAEALAAQRQREEEVC